MPIGFDEWAVSASERSSDGTQDLFTFKPDDGSALARQDASSLLYENGLDGPPQRSKSAPKLALTHMKTPTPGPGHYDQEKRKIDMKGSQSYSFGTCPERKNLPFNASWAPVSFATRVQGPGPGTYKVGGTDSLTEIVHPEVGRHGTCGGKLFSLRGREAFEFNGPKSETQSRKGPGEYSIRTTVGGEHPLNKNVARMWSIGRGAPRMALDGKGAITKSDTPGPGECNITMLVRPPRFTNVQGGKFGRRIEQAMTDATPSWTAQTSANLNPRTGPGSNGDMRDLPHYSGKPALLHPSGSGHSQCVTLKGRPKYDKDAARMGGCGPGQHNPKLLGSIPRGGAFLMGARNMNGPF